MHFRVARWVDGMGLFAIVYIQALFRCRGTRLQTSQVELALCSRHLRHLQGPK
jgi:hypothetical protein